MVVVDADEAVLWGGSGSGLVIRSASKGGELKKAVLLVGGKQNRLRVFYKRSKNSVQWKKLQPDSCFWNVRR